MPGWQGVQFANSDPKRLKTVGATPTQSPNIYASERRTNMTLHEFAIGTQVTNFEQTAKVCGYHELANALILEDASGMRWLADPKYCELA